jgi:hypothetical protein
MKYEKLPKDEYKKGDWDLLKEMGIELIGDSDDQLFYNVLLPEGWSQKAVPSSMFLELFDERGRKRAEIFHKTAEWCDRLNTISLLPEKASPDARASIRVIVNRFCIQMNYTGYEKDVLQWVVYDEARKLNIITGQPFKYAFSNESPGVVAGDKFYYNPVRRKETCEFSRCESAEYATIITEDKFSRKSAEWRDRTDSIISPMEAAENLAREGLSEALVKFLAGRDQWADEL